MKQRSTHNIVVSSGMSGMSSSCMNMQRTVERKHRHRPGQSVTEVCCSNFDSFCDRTKPNALQVTAARRTSGRRQQWRLLQDAISGGAVSELVVFLHLQSRSLCIRCPELHRSSVSMSTACR